MNKLFLLFASVLLTHQFSYAQSFKVVKIQGKKAIVEVSDPSQITVNQTYNVGDSTPAPSTSGGGKGGKREHSIGLNFSFLSQSSPSYSLMTLAGDYTWNFKSFEVGPVVSLTNTSSGGVSTSVSEFGGLGFYNFNQNKPGAETVFSLLGKLTVASSTGSSATNISFGPNYRWFLLSSDHCFSMSALYKMTQTSGASSSAFVLEAGILTYF